MTGVGYIKYTLNTIEFWGFTISLIWKLWYIWERSRLPFIRNNFLKSLDEVYHFVIWAILFCVVNYIHFTQTTRSVKTWVWLRKENKFARFFGKITFFRIILKFCMWSLTLNIVWTLHETKNQVLYVSHTMNKADIRIGMTDHLAVKCGIKIHRIEIDDVTCVIWV